MARAMVIALTLSLLHWQSAHAARDAQETIELRAYVNDTCIVADEPYFLPASANKDGADQAKFLPLLRRANVCVEGKARAVYEAHFEFSKDGTAYRLKDAGYRIESLLTTAEKGASRTTIYSMKISGPGASAWSSSKNA